VARPSLADAASIALRARANAAPIALRARANDPPTATTDRHSPTAAPRALSLEPSDSASALVPIASSPCEAPPQPGSRTTASSPRDAPPQPVSSSSLDGHTPPPSLADALSLEQSEPMSTPAPIASSPCDAPP
jgi:hypothetical protein